jgi:hypothetical protein
MKNKTAPLLARLLTRKTTQNEMFCNVNLEDVDIQILVKPFTNLSSFG